MRYLFKRGKGARRRVLHICGYDCRTVIVAMVLAEVVGFDLWSAVAEEYERCQP